MAQLEVLVLVWDLRVQSESLKPSHSFLVILKEDILILTHVAVGFVRVFVCGGAEVGAQMPFLTRWYF